MLNVNVRNARDRLVHQQVPSLTESVANVEKVLLPVANGQSKLVSFEQVYREIYNFYLHYCTGNRTTSDYLHVRHLCEILDRLTFKSISDLNAVADCFLYPLNQEKDVGQQTVPSTQKLVTKKFEELQSKLRVKLLVTSVLYHSTSPSLPAHLWDFIGKYIQIGPKK